MKKLIIILGCIVLGCYMFTLLLGNDASSFKSKAKEVWINEVNSYSPDK